MALELNGTTGVSLVQDGVVQTTDIADGAITADKVSKASSGSLLGWEHIETKIFTTDAEHQDANNYLKFTNVFSDDYACFKLVVPYGEAEYDANGAEVYLRLLDSSGTQLNSSSYQSVVEVLRADTGDQEDHYALISDAGYVIINQYTHGDTGTGGFQGEIIFYCVSSPTVKGSSVGYSSVRPIMKTDFVGFDVGTSDYTRQTGMIRYNSTLTTSNVTGFQLYTTSNYDFIAGTHMSLYGLRLPTS